MVSSGFTRPMRIQAHMGSAHRRCFAGNTITFDNRNSERMRPRSS
jgi:hypothetical protein